MHMPPHLPASAVHYALLLSNVATLIAADVLHQRMQYASSFLLPTPVRSQAHSKSKESRPDSLDDLGGQDQASRC